MRALKWIGLFLVVAVVLTLSIVLYLYQYKGLKYYLKANSYIKDNPEASVNFYGKNKFLQTGLLADKWQNGIWMWTDSSLKFFKSKEGVEYLSIKGCQNEIPKEEDVVTEKNLTFSEWGNQAYPGDYVVISFDEETGNEVIRIRSVDFWMFVDGDLVIQCKRGVLRNN